MYMSVCKGAERGGAYVLHGSRRAMHNDKQPAFKAVYSAFNAVSNKRNVCTQCTYHVVLQFTGIDYIDLQNDKFKNDQNCPSYTCSGICFLYLILRFYIVIAV